MKKVPLVRRDARPRRWFNGCWYSPDQYGHWRSDQKRRGNEPRQRLLHRAVWEFHHEPITRAVVIEFKDGRPDNCDITNLRCVKKVPGNVWHRWRAGIGDRPLDRTFAARVKASRDFWVRMSSGEREIYCLLRSLARRDAQQDRRKSRLLFQLAACGGAIHASAG